MSPDRAGLLIAVVGGSGVGKDTVMRAAAPLLPDVHFTRRVITRAQEPHERHEPVSQAEFDARERDGAFAATWHAHGLCYAIPIAVHAMVHDGEVVVVNGSRRALPAIHDAFERLAVIEIVAAPAIRAARLAGRGREPRAEIERRLAREASIDRRFAPRRVANETSVEDAARAFAATVRELRATAERQHILP